MPNTKTANHGRLLPNVRSGHFCLPVATEVGRFKANCFHAVTSRFTEVTLPRLLLLMGAFTLFFVAPLSPALAGSFEIPAWAYDRGNVRTFTGEWADAGPMVAFGGQSPVVVEYDIPFPATGVYRLDIRYAAATARPVELLVDGKRLATVCRTANGSWQTSGAAWEASASIEVAAGNHTPRLERPQIQRGYCRLENPPLFLCVHSQA